MPLRLILPGLYGLICAAAWLDFARLPPDGLANVGLMLTVLPVTLVDLGIQAVIARERSVFMLQGLGYYKAHAVFFWTAAAVLAGCLYLAGAAVDRRRARS